MPFEKRLERQKVADGTCGTCNKHFAFCKCPTDNNKATINAMYANCLADSRKINPPELLAKIVEAITSIDDGRLAPPYEYPDWEVMSAAIRPIIDQALKAAFNNGAERMKKRARFANNVLPDDVRANDTRSYDAGFYKGATEQRKAIDAIPLPECGE
jgi:hypothetical protein